jgi:peptidoglycan-associated lipoprotein
MHRIAVFAVGGLLVAGGAFARPASANEPPEGAQIQGGEMQQQQPQEVYTTPSGVKCVRNKKVTCIPSETCGHAKVHFAFNSSKLTEDSKAALDCAASCLKASPNMKVVIEGGTDDVGGREFNKALGQKRADAVAEYLTSQGVSNQQLGTISLGKEHPLCASTSASCRQRNRRAQIVPAAPVALAP